MQDDYRNTDYCPKLNNIDSSKRRIVDLIKKDHPKAQNMHSYISNTKKPYKKLFIKAYNGKCSYCGVSIDLIPNNSFEIDHFIYKEDTRFSSKVEAGKISNLVLACHKCNHAKSSFAIPPNYCETLHPDKIGITETFVRDDNYYIRISDSKAGDEYIARFYKKLELDAEVHRIDYLLMNMIGLKNEMKDNCEAYICLDEAIDLLRKKRNLMG